jgi:hypothetical protein
MKTPLMAKNPVCTLYGTSFFGRCDYGATDSA